MTTTTLPIRWLRGLLFCGSQRVPQRTGRSTRESRLAVWGFVCYLRASGILRFPISFSVGMSTFSTISYQLSNKEPSLITVQTRIFPGRHLHLAQRLWNLSKAQLSKSKRHIGCHFSRSRFHLPRGKNPNPLFTLLVQKIETNKKNQKPKKTK